MTIAWDTIAKLTGADPADFQFGVILNSSDDGTQRTARTRRFANDASYRLANCTATLVLPSLLRALVTASTCMSFSGSERTSAVRKLSMLSS